MEKSAKQIIKEFDSIKNSRATMESSWQDLKDMFYPVAEDINDKSPNDGSLKRSFQYTDTPYLSLQVLSAGLHSYLTGPTTNWFTLKPQDDKLSNNKTIKQFLEETEIVIKNSIANTNFETEQDTFYMESACFGSAAMLIEEDEEDDLRFTSIPIKHIFWKENAQGRIDTWYIRFEYTPHQAVSKFGIENVSKKVRDIYQRDNCSEEKGCYIFYVSPRYIRDESKRDNLNMPVKAQWIDVDSELIVQDGGYEESPFAYHRFEKRKDSPYGYSPCMATYKSAKQLNQTLKTTLRGLSMAIDGPMDVPVGSYVGKIDLGPGKLLYRKGDEKMSPIKTNVGLGPTDYLINYYTDLIKDGLYNKAIVALGDITKRMHTFEAQELVAEKMVLLGPAVGRFTEEFASNVIKRSLAILARKGKLPLPPEELGDNFEYKIEFISPLVKAQRSNEMQGINTVLGIAQQMAAFAPEVLDNINPDNTIKEVGDVSGATTKLFRDESEVDNIRRKRIEAMEQQQAMQQMQQVAEMEQEGQV